MRTALLIGLASALLGGLLSLAVPTLPAMHPAVRAAGSILVTPRALVGGRFGQGGWLAILVDLRNDGPPVSGAIVANGSDGQVRRAVDLPAGARKQLALYVHPEAFIRTLKVTLVGNDGSALASGDAQVQVLESGVSQVAVIGDSASILRSQLAARAAPGLPQPLSLSPADLPERPEPLAGLATIVWAGDSGSLTEPQRRSLERWIAGGGNLVVLGGPDWQARTAAFTDILPVDGLAARDGASLTDLARFAGNAALPTGATATIASGAPRNGAIALADLPAASGGGPLLTAISHGGGRVTFLGADLASDPLRGWRGAPLLLGRLVPDNRLALQFTGGAPVDLEFGAMLGQALSNIPALEVPPAELLVLVIVGYILLIGPISYIVLRRRDRRDLAWVTAPLLVLIFSAGTYGIGWTLKGSQVIVNEVDIIRVAAGGDAASVQSYAGVFSPSRSSYDLTVRADALLSAVNSNNNFTGAGGPLQQTAGTYVIEQGNPAHLRGLAVSVFGLQAIRSDAVVPYQPDLEIDWRLEGDAVTGTIHNGSQHAVDDVAVIGQGVGVMVGTLQPGARRDFRLVSANLNGSPVSEQIYGSNGNQQDTPEQRTFAMRRQVLDALTGFGGKFPVGMLGGAPVTAGGSGGPMVVGWRADAAPVAIDVDGLAPQHYRQSLEVISGRPRIASGAISLSPASLPVDIVSTAGDASTQQGPGGVFMSKGEAVFRISLPLEAARMQPTELTVLASQDPGAVFASFGNPGGFPPGFRVAILRLATGEWDDLGDPSLSGSLTVTNAAGAIDDGGQILVRVTANGPANGGAQVFVGAQVRGEMP
ncbi:MAG: hypothetical protein E6J39_06645 [Chloroflexi bacterium]|nr:MAG: hypothetical protein E6J39_06645 [Chloroflexota bacterium]